MIHFEKKKYLNFFLIPNSKPNFCEQSTDHSNVITFEDNDLKDNKFYAKVASFSASIPELS